MTTLNLKEVKQTVNKLSLNLIIRLLVSCDKNCSLIALDDANNTRTILKRNRDKLAYLIFDSNAVDIYNQAKDLANALTECDDLIKAKEEEHAPIKAQYKVANAEIKQLKEDKKALIERKINELEKNLDDRASEKITQYNSIIESEKAKTKRQEQRTKALKELGKGLIASELDGITEEFGEAICEATDVTFKFLDKLRARIKDNNESNIDFDTVEGLNTVNKKFARAWKTHETQIVNNTGLNPDWKNDRVVPFLSEVGKEPNQIMPAIDVEVIDVDDDLASVA